MRHTHSVLTAISRRAFLERSAGALAASTGLMAHAQAEEENTYGVQRPELRSRAEVNAVLGKAPKPALDTSLRPLTILFAGGAKDHPPRSHSHDVLPKRWKVLLGGAGPGDEAVTNMYRPKMEADLLGLAKGTDSRYKHKVVTLKLPQSPHPIMHGLPGTFTVADECFWNLQGDRSKITALATSDEIVGDQVRAEPVIWAYERGKGRVVASTLGHFDWTFDDPFFRTILLRGIAWTAGESPYRFDPLILRGIPLKG